MDQELIMPQYKTSILNLMSSIMNHYKVKSDYPSLAQLDTYLNKSPKHLLLFIFDGLGARLLKEHLPETSFLRRHMVGEIQSVFPPTTTAAMTSYYTGVSPAQHGWLGWSLYFKEYCAPIDIFTNCHSKFATEMVTKRIAYKELPYKSVYEKIHDVKGNKLVQHTLKPASIHFPSTANRHHPIRDLDHMTKALCKINTSNSPTFSSAYWPEPDLIIHNEGPSADSTKQMIVMIDHYLEDLAGKLKDTLLIVSADHGLIGINREFDLSDNKAINHMLVMPPSIEKRCVSFFIKDGYKESFEHLFKETYGEYFRLYSKQAIVDQKFFGEGNYHPRFDDFIGDYLAIGISDALLKYSIKGGPKGHPYKGHHAGLCAEEMMVPLIVIEK